MSDVPFTGPIPGRGSSACDSLGQAKFHPGPASEFSFIDPYKDMSHNFFVSNGTSVPVIMMPVVDQSKSASKFSPTTFQPSTGPTRSKRRGGRTGTSSHFTGDSQASSGISAPTTDAESRELGSVALKKNQLSLPDKANFNRAFDLLVLEVLTRIGWESDRFIDTAIECLQHASAESNHDTPWSEEMSGLFQGSLQTFRSKIGKAACSHAGLFHLPETVDPDGSLSPQEKEKAIVLYRERVLNPKNWRSYLLHHYDEDIGFSFFANPTFLDFHVRFWYDNSSSPVSRQDEVESWPTTPLDMLAMSVCAITFGIRHATGATQPNSKSASQRQNIRFSKVYNHLREKILDGMQGVLVHPDDGIRNRFSELLVNLHMQGLALRVQHSGLQSADICPPFYLPTVAELQAAFTPAGQQHSEPDSAENRRDEEGTSNFKATDTIYYGNTADTTADDGNWMLAEGLGL